MDEDMTFRPSAELMQNDEVLLFARLFTELGFDKFRLTGGEPTVRKDIVEIVRGIAETPGVREVSMTTNGLLLKDLAQPLAEAGLKRLNISIDTLNTEKFNRITRWGHVEDVWAGIEAAEQAGLLPIKLNAVVVRGYNDGQDVVDLARLTLYHNWQVRFIEMMPFGDIATFQQESIITDEEIRARVEAELGPLSLLGNGKLDGEARLYRLEEGLGTLGFISSVTQPFCATCTRARLTADGVLRLCLLREKEVDLLTPLRTGATLDELKQIILDGIWHKPWGHGLGQNVVPLNRVMSEIGG
jgi:cyclic pyranopterin phosphate synthase